jgi:hypothetical protein
MKSFSCVRLLVMALFFCLGCDKVDQLLTFTITDDTAIRIESTSPLNLPFEIPTPDITTNSNQEFQNNNTRADLVKDVTLQELKLTITNPTGRNFSFLKAVHLFISTNQSNEIELASLDNINTQANTITLIPTTRKLDEYIKASHYKLRTRIVTRETLTQAVDVRVDLRFRVTAHPIK